MISNHKKAAFTSSSKITILIVYHVSLLRSLFTLSGFMSDLLYMILLITRLLMN